MTDSDDPMGLPLARDAWAMVGDVVGPPFGAGPVRGGCGDGWWGADLAEVAA